MATSFIILDNLRYKSASQANSITRGWPMHHYQIREALGLNPKRLPVHAVPPQMIGNVKVWVLPRSNNSRRQHRVMCQCPRCHGEGPAGRLAQHIGKGTCKPLNLTELK